MRNGYILLHRKGITPEDWKHPRRTLAWFDLLTLTNYEDGIVTASYGFLAGRWRVSKHTAYDWMQHFIRERQLERKGERDGERNGERWFVVNYAKYQSIEERVGERKGERRRERKGEPKKEVSSTKLEEPSHGEIAATPLKPIQKHLIPLAVFTLAKGITFDNSDELKGFLTRFLRASQALQGYSPEKILRTFFFCVQDAKGQYDITLETIGKKIDMHHDHKLNQSQQAEFGDIMNDLEQQQSVIFTKTSPLIRV